MMTTEEFFAEAKRLNLRVLGTPQEIRAALDMKDAEIERLQDTLKRQDKAHHQEVQEQVAAERERCAKLCDAKAEHVLRAGIPVSGLFRTLARDIRGA